jgi:hypothetical protein
MVDPRIAGENTPDMWVPMLRHTVPDRVILDWVHLLGLCWIQREPEYSSSMLQVVWRCSFDQATDRMAALIDHDLAVRILGPDVIRIRPHAGPGTFNLNP